MEIKSIGVIHSPYKARHETPTQGVFRHEMASNIEVFKEYEEGLKDIEGFSHLIVLYWLHKSEGYSLLITTPWDKKPHGLFTTRSPDRPNPLGLSVVELIERNGNTLKVNGLDAIDYTHFLT